MRAQLYASDFRVLGWNVVICWDVLRFAYRWWNHRREVTMFAPWPQEQYDVRRDCWRTGILLGPIAAWRAE